MDEFKIVLKKKLIEIGNSIRIRNKDTKKYTLSELPNEIRNILIKITTYKPDHRTTLFDSLHFETDSQYYINGELHNPFYPEDTVMVYPAIKQAIVNLVSKKETFFSVTDEKGCFGFSKSKKDLIPFEWDDLMLYFEGSIQHEKSLSDKIVLFLRLKFEGPKLSQKLENKELSKYNETFNNWFSPEDGFTFFVDEKKITSEWINLKIDKDNNRNMIENLDDKTHNFYIFNESKTIKVIPDNAFKGWSITEANIPPSVRMIGDMSFMNCLNLQKINICDGVDTIGAACFENCKSLKTIKLSKTITQIPVRCFKDCTELEEIHLHDKTKYLGAACFEGCSSLKTIRIDAKLPPKQLGAFTRLKVENLKVIVPDESVAYYKTNFSGFDIIKLSDWEVK